MLKVAGRIVDVGTIVVAGFVFGLVAGAAWPADLNQVNGDLKVEGKVAVGTTFNASTEIGVVSAGGDIGIHATGEDYGIYAEATGDPGTAEAVGLAAFAKTYGVGFVSEDIGGLIQGTTKGMVSAGKEYAFTAIVTDVTGGTDGPFDGWSGLFTNGGVIVGVTGEPNRFDRAGSDGKMYVQDILEVDGTVYADGDVYIGNNLTKGGGSFKIDHPLDPANKFLYHSFVESPEMMNVYSGVVTLEDDGTAEVELPDWFQALNRDYRYQLTPIGASAPGLYISREISENRFAIAGGSRGLRVSWLVTGVRQDPYAVAHRIEVEVEKSPAERGKYLYPVEYGQPEELAINARRRTQRRTDSSDLELGNRIREARETLRRETR